MTAPEHPGTQRGPYSGQTPHSLSSQGDGVGTGRPPGIEAKHEPAVLHGLEFQ